LGIHVCGGRGKHSRQTPHELFAIGERVGLDGSELAKASRLIAKVDSAAVQDGFDLYMHGFIVTDDGRWVVVQQGMNGQRRQDRRYHWLSEDLKSFVEEPHAAIDGLGQGQIINLTDRRAAASRRMQLEALQSLGPNGIARELRGVEAREQEPTRSRGTEQPLLPHLVLPAHHEVRVSDVFERRLPGTLAAAADCGPAEFPELLLIPGVGRRTVQALAMVAEVVHGAPYRFTDPARFSFAHGSKDRHPFAVPLRVYDQTIQVLKSAVQKAKLGQAEQLAALERLDEQAQRLERHASGPTVPELIAQERQCSPSYGGRSVFGWERDAPSGSVGNAQRSMSRPPDAMTRRRAGASRARPSRITTGSPALSGTARAITMSAKATQCSSTR
jgi:hypothetical protein